MNPQKAGSPDYLLPHGAALATVLVTHAVHQPSARKPAADYMAVTAPVPHEEVRMVTFNMVILQLRRRRSENG
jgi:hypothetical protein